MHRLLLLSLGIAALLATGCATPASRDQFVPTNKSDPREIAKDDVFQIASFASRLPWLERDGRAVGMWLPVFFVSGKTEKGVFVPGDIYVWVWKLTRTLDGDVAELVKVWQFDEREAFGLRKTKTTMMGDGYGLILEWGDINLEGERILLQIGYRRLDGRDILSPQREFLVSGRALGTRDIILERPGFDDAGTVDQPAERRELPRRQPDAMQPANPQPVFPDEE